MQSLSLTALFGLHILGYGAIYLALGAPMGWTAGGLAALLIWISVVDADRFEIPDIASALLAFSGLVLAIALPIPLLVERLAGGFVWPLIFWAVGLCYLRHRGVHGLGFGDVKLMAGIGLWCGFTGTTWVVLAASVAGMAVLGLGAVTGRLKAKMLGNSMVAFGPFLCLSAWTIWLSGARI